MASSSVPRFSGPRDEHTIPLYVHVISTMEIGKVEFDIADTNFEHVKGYQLLPVRECSIIIAEACVRQPSDKTVSPGDYA